MSELKLTHLTKIYWPKEKITKGVLIEYYQAVASRILPYLKNRPISMHRFPEGITGESFYQKEAGPSVPDFVKTAPIKHENKTVNYIIVNNAKTLLYVVNLGSIELHPFHSSLGSLDKPDYLLLDLDPENISFDAVVKTALEIRAILEKLKIPCFCKTSGGRGLHILIPLKAKYTYEQSKHFAQVIAREVHKRLPEITSLERLPKKRQKKVYIDCLQNNKGQTMACPYSVRAKPGAPVSTPLDWKEVRKGLDPKKFTIKTVLKRFGSKRDLMKGILGKGINLQSAIKKFEKMFQSK